MSKELCISFSLSHKHKGLAQVKYNSKNISQTLFSHELFFIPYPRKHRNQSSFSVTGIIKRKCSYIPLPIDPASPKATEVEGSSHMRRSMDTGQPKHKDKLSSKETINRSVTYSVPVFFSLNIIFPFLHPVFKDRFGIKNETQYHNYLLFLLNGSSLVSCLFFKSFVAVPYVGNMSS